MKNTNTVLIVLGILLVSFLFWKNYTPGETLVVDNIKNTPAINRVSIGDTFINVRLADTPEKKELGLGGTQSMPEDEGMLFIFNQSYPYPFWMKGMLFPIDIIWVDGNGKIIFIKKNATVESYPETFAPALPAKYVLEVNSGFTDRHNINEGDTISFLP